MYCLTAKVLAVRWLYMMRQRWCTTALCLATPLVFSLLFVHFMSYFEVKNIRTQIPVNTHDRISLLEIRYELDVVVCPDGPAERLLMQTVNSLLVYRKGWKTNILNITFVDKPNKMVEILRKLNSSKIATGLHFHEINRSRLKYTIRPLVNVQTMIFGNDDGFETSKSFPSPMKRGPRRVNSYFTWFIPLQVAVDEAFIQANFPNITREWMLISFPYPTFESPSIPNYSQILGFFATTALTIGIIGMVCVLCLYVIKEKMNGVRELLHVNGATRWMVNFSWLVTFGIEAAILAVIEMAIFAIYSPPYFKYMGTEVLVVALILHSWVGLCWGYTLGTFLSSEQWAIAVIVSFWALGNNNSVIEFGSVAQAFAVMLPNGGLAMFFLAFLEFDAAETMLGFEHLFTSPVHYLPVGVIFVLMLVTIILLVLLSVYIDFVKPGPFGRAKPWYLFPFKENMIAHQPSTSEGTYFEGISEKAPIALECIGIYKSFGKLVAVDNVSLKFERNTVTVLLGHNGAGKTTLFSILCGMYSPTKGSLHTEGYNVFEGRNLSRFQSVLGYCPQISILMNELTVEQHLVIFGLLKGLTKTEALDYCEYWTNIFGISRHRKTKARLLSGGTKRKLSLAIAMTGDPMYLLLDEPSSGLDPESALTFWNVILKEKARATIILTTHNMDEADVIGDRVAFMGDGKLKGYGTNAFLKKTVEVKYKLMCAFKKEEDAGKVTSFVKKYDPSASILFQTDRTVTYGLTSNVSNDISNLMKNLESEFGDGMASSLSSTSMDDVFLKIQPDQENLNTDGILLQKSDFNRSICNLGSFFELIRKRLEWLWNQGMMVTIFIVVVIPVLGVVAQLVHSSPVPPADLEFTMAKYSGSEALMSGDGANLMYRIIKSDMEKGEIDTVEVNPGITMSSYLLHLAEKDLFRYRSKLLFAFDTSSSEPTAYYSRNAYHAAPIAYSALINAILLRSSRIVTYNFPLKMEDTTGCEGDLKLTQILTSMFTVVYIGLILLELSAYFIVFPHTERHNLFKHLQLMTGLLPSTYWLSNFIFDMVLYLISISLMFIVCVIADPDLAMNPDVMPALIYVLLLYGVSSITFSYSCSFIKCGTRIVLLFYILVQLVVYFGFWVVLGVLGRSGILISSFYVRFFPWINLVYGLSTVTYWLVAQEFCNDCANLQGCSYIMHPLLGQLGAVMASFVITTVVCSTFIIAMDHGFGRKLKPIWTWVCQGSIDDSNKAIDPDVAKEKEHVRELDTNENAYQPTLVVDGLGKRYASKKKVAVRDVTFVTDRGEMFGLLGTNGAGKTTTFGMLSGLIGPTKGTVAVMGRWEVVDCEYLYIRNIGYSPQFEGLLPGLTGRTTLRLFGRLRGLKNPTLRSQVDFWLNALNMTSLADRPCQNYSGGNKKKLNFAAAMIGNPPVALLDEPTTGIDPVVRRRIWTILMASLKLNHQAVVLSSHTMSECESICDRLTIMVEGEMKCLGSIPKLKNTFGKSVILAVKLIDNFTPSQKKKVHTKIMSRFPDQTELQQSQNNVLIFHIKTIKMKAYDVFATILKIKEETPVIDDFSLTETPLEEIFMRFAQQQGRPVDDNPGTSRELSGSRLEDGNSSSGALVTPKKI